MAHTQGRFRSEAWERVLRDLERASILLHEQKVTLPKDCLPLLERVTKEGGSLLVVAEEP
jgi:hypothetical protein